MLIYKSSLGQIFMFFVKKYLLNINNKSAITVGEIFCPKELKYCIKHDKNTQL